MSKIVVTTDPHFSDAPADEYRWRVFDEITVLKPTHVIILGDICHKKDRHSAELVNRLVAEIKKLTSRGVRLTMLLGNHDKPLRGPPFWSFLSEIEGVTFVTNPLVLDTHILLLPHAESPRDEWANIDFSLYKCIMMHQTVTGADIGNGIQAVVEDMVQFPANIPVYSGDIHYPQKVNGVEYIGTPHPVIFGEDHKHRLLVLDPETYRIQQEVELRPIKKHAFVVHSVDELKQMYVRSGDQAKIDMIMPNARIEQWPAERAEIAAWAAISGVHVFSTNARVQPATGEYSVAETSKYITDPIEVLVEYGEEKGISIELIGDAYEMLEAALKSGAVGSNRFPHTLGNVTLDYLYLRDYKSFRGEHEIFPDPHKGLKFVGGTNKESPRLGANGAGKTTLWDSIVWCLTGQSIRGGRASDVVSWGVKSPRVIVGLQIDETFHTIERVGSPNRLLLDGNAIEQKELDSYLLSRKQLLHSVIFGQSVKLFYDMEVSERGTLLDEVMTLDLWVRLSDEAAKYAVQCNNTITTMEREASNIEGQITAYDRQLPQLVDSSAQHTQTANVDLIVRYEALMAHDIETQRVRQDLDVLYDDHKALPDLAAARRDMQRMTDEIGAVRGRIILHANEMEDNSEYLTFLDRHTNCPTCGQDIADGHKHLVSPVIRDKAREAEQKHAAAREEENALVQVQNETRTWYDGAVRYENELNQKVALHQQMLAMRAKEYAQMESDYARIYEGMQNNPYAEQIEKLQSALVVLRKGLEEHKAEINTVAGRKEVYDFWRNEFRKVRLFQIKQVIARLELETANAASALGIGDWRIQYTTEIETKSGTMKPGVHITVFAPNGTTVAEESAGENQRVRIAVSMGLSALIQNLAGINFQFEAWDEPSAWLSPEGIDDLLEKFHERAMTLNKSIYLLDHRVLTHSDFSEVWHVTKTIHGSAVDIRFP